MNEGREFVGRKYSQEEEDGMRAAMGEWAKQASEPFEGEQQKTEEEMHMIEVINDLIREELVSLGITDYAAAEPARVHLLSAEVFQREFTNGPHAIFLPAEDLAAVNCDNADTDQSKFADILHELIHRASLQLFYGSKDKRLSYARLGYHFRTPWKQENERDVLQGFNEILLVHTQRKIFMKNAELLRREFGFTSDDLDGPIYNYMRYAPLLQSIVTSVSGASGMSESEVFDEFELGQFRLKIPIMKEIARAYGGKALRTLSYLMALPEGEEREKLDSDIIRYFATEDRATRDILGEEIHEYFLTHHNIQDENGNSTNTV